MRPAGPASELSSPGPHVPSSLSDSPLTSGPSSLPSCSLGSPMTTSMTNTTTTTSNDGAGLGPLPDPDTPDPSRPEGPSSPLLGNINDISGLVSGAQVPDENLTQEQRRKREEKLGYLKQLKSQMFPDDGGPMGGGGPGNMMGPGGPMGPNGQMGQ